VSGYVIRFMAVNPDDLDAAAAQRIEGAAQVIPGTRLRGRVLVDPLTRRIEADFAIEVAQAMAEAARDGGRPATEILLAARMLEARLVEGSARMGDPHSTD